jgi:hypothetical protein
MRLKSLALAFVQLSALAMPYWVRLQTRERERRRVRSLMERQLHNRASYLALPLMATRPPNWPFWMVAPPKRKVSKDWTPSKRAVVQLPVPITGEPRSGEGEADAETAAEGEPEAEGDGDLLAAVDADTEGDGDLLTDADADTEGDGDLLTDAEAEGDAGRLAEAEADAEGEGGLLAEAEAEGDAGRLAEAEGDAEGEGGLLAEAEADGDGGRLAEADADAEGEGGRLAEAEADAEGEGGLLADADAEADAEAVATPDDWAAVERLQCDIHAFGVKKGRERARGEHVQARATRESRRTTLHNCAEALWLRDVVIENR